MPVRCPECNQFMNHIYTSNDIAIYWCKLDGVLLYAAVGRSETVKTPLTLKTARGNAELTNDVRLLASALRAVGGVERLLEILKQLEAKDANP